MSLYTCYLCEETKSKDDSPCTAYYPRAGQSDSKEEVICEECSFIDFPADEEFKNGNFYNGKDIYGRVR